MTGGKLAAAGLEAQLLGELQIGEQLPMGIRGLGEGQQVCIYIGSTAWGIRPVRAGMNFARKGKYPAGSILMFGSHSSAPCSVVGFIRPCQQLVLLSSPTRAFMTA